MRPVRIAPIECEVRTGPAGVSYVRSPHRLAAYPTRITERLELWAERTPTRTFLAQRGQGGEWRTLSYAEALGRARRIAQGLLHRRLSPDRPVVILSGNGIEHALLALAATYAGVVYAPVSPEYSRRSRDYAALRRIFELVRPALVFAAEGEVYEPALAAVLPPGAELVTCSPARALPATPFEELESAPATSAVDDAHRRVQADTVAKILFTSGSTGRPKGVLNTQRMLCSNQEMLRSVLLFLAEEPPVLCDWSPWNHTAGGNHNFGLVLYNGGTLYIDEGKPLPGLFDATLRNLREVECTAHFAVPRTYELLMPHLRSDPRLRETFFRRLKLLFYAAAGLGQRFWDQLRDLALEACGEEILIMTGFGSTETAPFALSTGKGAASAGMLGLPAPGLELKLAPAGSKLEARVRGPNVTPGYWRDEGLTAAAFDEEGFYRMGDAMQWVDGGNPQKGLFFDGRLAEDFKLSTGTWVSVGPLRSRVLAAAGGYAQDVVIAGPDRPFAAALIVPSLPACRRLAGAAEDAPTPAVLADPRVTAAFQAALEELARQGGGSSMVVARAQLLEEPPSLDAGEVTDKGSLNQKAMLANRAPLVDELYRDPPPPRVLACRAASDRAAGGWR